MAGQEVASASTTVPTLGQMALLLTELVPGLKSVGWTGGLVEVTSDQEVAGTSLFITTRPDGMVILSTGTPFQIMIK